MNAVVMSAAPPCKDIKPPDSEFSCKEQAEFGQCDAKWMISGKYCALSCKRCPGGCKDILPPNSEYSCEDQALFDKCDKKWMLAGNFCALSCNRCGDEPEEPIALPERRRADPVRIPEPPIAEAAPSSLVYDVTNPEAPLQRRASIIAPPVQEQYAFEQQPEEAIEEDSIPSTPQGQLAEQAALLTGPDEGLVVEPVVIQGPPRTAADAGSSWPIEKSYNCTKPPRQAARRVAPGARSLNQTTLWEALQATPSLDTFVQALNATDLVELLDDPTANFTIFAPSNDAFDALAESLGATISSILSATDSLTAVLNYHMLENDVYSAEELATLSSVQPRESEPVLFVLVRGDAIGLVGRGSNARVGVPNAIKGCGFFVHIMDAVLLPMAGRGGVNPTYSSQLELESALPPIQAQG